MFIKQGKAETIEKRVLEAGRSIEVVLMSGEVVHGIVDFISECHGAHNIFVNTSKEERCIIKIYSNRTLVELVTYTQTHVMVDKIKGITVTSARKQEYVSISNLEYDFTKMSDTHVPVVVGDRFTKSGHTFEVLAIAKNGGTMFLEDVDTGAAITVGLNDQILIDTFNGFTWGDPTK